MTTPTTTPTGAAQAGRKRSGPTRRRRLAAGALVGALGAGLLTIADPAVAAVPTGDPMVPSAVVTQDEVEAAMARLRADGMLVESFAFDGDELDTARFPALASQFGLFVFQGVLQGGGRMGFDYAMSQLGFDPSGQTTAIREIGASIEELNAEVQALSRQIESVLDGQDRANFYNSYSAAGTASSRLSVALSSVGAWMAVGANPSASNVSDMQTIVRTSVADLSFQVANQTTGTIPLMMKAAEPADVSDLEAYWKAIDTARTDYRAVLAQGLATLELLEQWDYTGTVAADLETLIPVATDTVRGIYGYGLQPVTPEGTKAVFVRNHRGAYAPWQEVADPDSTFWWQVDVSSSGIRPYLEAMVREYEPHLNGGASLEQWLRSRGMPTAYVFAGSVETEVTHQKTHLANVRNVVHQERVRVMRVQGNQVSEDWFDLNPERVAWNEVGQVVNGQVVWRVHQGDPVAAEATAQAERSAWQSDISNHTPRWTSVNDAHAKVMYLPVPLNVGGFSADIHPDRIRAAAFG